jgi:TM2 domain-containing membrane protein YozV
MDQGHKSAEYELRKKSPGLAAFISFLLPGAGQMYGGKILKGIIWLIAGILGYWLWVVPGIIIHICCIVNAYKTIQRYNFELLKSLSSLQP